MPLFQGFRPVAGTICPSRAAAVVGPSRAPQGMKRGRRPRRRPRLKLSDKAGPDQCPVPGENALFPAQIAGFLAVSRPVPVYPVFLNYVVPVQEDPHASITSAQLVRCRPVVFPYSEAYHVLFEIATFFDTKHTKDFLIFECDCCTISTKMRFFFLLSWCGIKCHAPSP